jgi:helix-turn-helix protein
MSGQPRQIDSQTLYSWKEIAVFLKCGVRTAQRWERNQKLPTHRHNHIRRGTVYAFKDEIQEWMKSRAGAQALASVSSTSHDPVSFPPAPGVPPVQLRHLYHLCERARQRAQRVRGSFAAQY